MTWYLGQANLFEIVCLKQSLWNQGLNQTVQTDSEPMGGKYHTEPNACPAWGALAINCKFCFQVPCMPSETVLLVCTLISWHCLSPGRCSGQLQLSQNCAIPELMTWARWKNGYYRNLRKKPPCFLRWISMVNGISLNWWSPGSLKSITGTHTTGCSYSECRVLLIIIFL